jgi:hypothetical protein
VGSDGPLAYEVYARSGASLLLGNSILDQTLKTGWMIEGGARVLWFNPEETRAWALDLSISNVAHEERNRNLIHPVLRNILVPDGAGGVTSVPEIPVTVTHFNRTFVNVSIGREWYLLPPASCGSDWSVRLGTDVGGRWGTGKLELVELPSRQDVMGGAYIAVHSDVEIPCGACILQVGFRVECDYTWTDILQRQNIGDLIDLNLLLNLGVRF